ncbi:MAG: response regulator transcription factor [Chitinophagaceae bacterium]|nr:response regulator transcription factor [Chitinophagaceae bacterium]
MQQLKSQSINIAIADDHSLFRSGIVSLLEEFGDIHVEFEANNGKELQEKIARHPQISVILMDINMPIVNGFSATTWIKENYPEISVLALSMHNEDEAIIKMIKAGAKGYILKESNAKELHKAIHDIYVHGFYSNEYVSGKLLRSFQNENEKKQKPLFSQKEIRFMQLSASELTYKEIAKEMGLADRSADNYRQALFERLGIKTRVGLVLYAIKEGIIKV